MKPADAATAHHWTVEDGLREIVRRHPRGCGIIYGNRPKGFTCLDMKREAADPTARFGDEYRARLLSGEHDCDVCIAREALEALDG